MKRISFFLIVLILLTTSALMAQFKPYGSARIGYWYENEDENWSSTGESRMNLNYYLQSNSRFGARFSDGDMNGRIEFGGTGSIRLLWASYDMGSYKILVGQNETLLTQKGTMNFGSENNFVGWGAIDNSRRPQVRIEMDNGLAIAFVEPAKVDVDGISQDKSVLLPKLNLGYKGKLADNINFAGALGINHYNYNEDDGVHDDAVLAYVLGLLFDMKFDAVNLKLHFNYGQNTANYGLGSQTKNKAMWDGNEIVNVNTMGGFGEFSYKLNDKTGVTLGASYTMSDSDAFDNSDTAMAAFAQLKQSLGKKFTISPEIGMLNRMKDHNEVELGSLVYFGTQLRMDF
jgi:hypothetical protein